MIRRSIAAIAAVALLTFLGWQLVTLEYGHHTKDPACHTETKPDGEPERICPTLDAMRADRYAHPALYSPQPEESPLFDCRLDGNKLCGTSKVQPTTARY